MLGRLLKLGVLVLLCWACYRWLLSPPQRLRWNELASQLAWLLLCVAGLVLAGHLAGLPP